MMAMMRPTHTTPRPLAALAVLLAVAGPAPGARAAVAPWQRWVAPLEWQELMPASGRFVPWARMLLDPNPLAEIGERPDPIPLFTSPLVTGTPAPAGSDPGCPGLLASEGMAFELGPEREGVATPVTIAGAAIGGVLYRYYYRGTAPWVFDCRLALALIRAAPVLRANGVSEVIFASHYRPSFGVLKPGQYHFHAQGLAIDVKGFRVGRDLLLDVARDYEPGLGFMDPASCVGRPLTKKGWLLRKIVCDLDESDAFEAILTPDYDEQHWNHFHFSAFHPLQRSGLRPRGTALLEVPMAEIPDWALARPLQQQPEARHWDRVAARPWPAAFGEVRQRLGLAAPAGGPEDARALLEAAAEGEGLLAQVAGLLGKVPAEVWELLELASGPEAEAEAFDLRD